MAYYTRNILRNPGRPSGDPQGKIKVCQDDVRQEFPWRKVRVDLYNYNIDGNVPKPEHKKWILEQLVPFLKSNNYHVQLYGRADRSVSHVSNGGTTVQYGKASGTK